MYTTDTNYGEMVTSFRMDMSPLCLLAEEKCDVATYRVTIDGMTNRYTTWPPEGDISLKTQNINDADVYYPFDGENLNLPDDLDEIDDFTASLATATIT